MKGVFRWLGIPLLLVSFALAAHSAGVTDLLDICTGANNSYCPYKDDARGNVKAAGATYSGTVTQNGAVTQSTTTFTGGLAPMKVTAAQVAALTANTTGQVVFCTNCTAFNNGLGEVCFSTGTTAVNQFVAISSAAAVTACK